MALRQTCGISDPSISDESNGLIRTRRLASSGSALTAINTASPAGEAASELVSANKAKKGRTVRYRSANATRTAASALPSSSGTNSVTVSTAATI
ncbi:hypothetical protein GCM10027038_30490 [Arthrobacter bambusae]